MRHLLRNLTSKNIYSVFLHIAVVVLAAEVYVLANQNRELKRLFEWTNRERLAEGDSMSLEGLLAVASRAPRISASDPTIAFVMTTTCPFCKRNLSSWETIVRVARSNRVQVVGISLDSLERTLAYIEEQAIDFPVYIPRDIGDYRRQNKLFGVPATVLRDSAGIVRRIWTGLLTESDISDVVRTITKNNVMMKKETNHEEARLDPFSCCGCRDDDAWRCSITNET